MTTGTSAWRSHDKIDDDGGTEQVCATGARREAGAGLWPTQRRDWVNLGTRSCPLDPRLQMSASPALAKAPPRRADPHPDDSLDSVTVPVDVERRLFPVTSALGDGGLPVGGSPPIAGRQAIRTALRRSLASRRHTNRREPARITRLRLAAGRGAVALQQADAFDDPA